MKYNWTYHFDIFDFDSSDPGVESKLFSGGQPSVQGVELRTEPNAMMNSVEFNQNAETRKLLTVSQLNNTPAMRSLEKRLEWIQKRGELCGIV